MLPKKKNCHFTPLPPHDGHLSTTVTFFFPYKVAVVEIEVWLYSFRELLSHTKMLKDNNINYFINLHLPILSHIPRGEVFSAHTKAVNQEIPAWTWHHHHQHHHHYHVSWWRRLSIQGASWRLIWTCIDANMLKFFFTIPRLHLLLFMNKLFMQCRGGSKIFFRRGCTRLVVSCSTSTPINHIVFFFAEYQLY